MRRNKEVKSIERTEKSFECREFKYLSQKNTPVHKKSKSVTESSFKLLSSTKHVNSVSKNLEYAQSYNLTRKVKDNFTACQVFPIKKSNMRLVKIQKQSMIEDKIQWKSLNLPVLPADVLRDFGECLTPYEEIEILTVTEIWYIGIGAQKGKIGMKNHGFDDDNDDYRVIFRDHLAYRYEILNILGSGSFGVVVKVLDHKENKEFAVKIVKSGAKYNESAENEIEILMFMNGNDLNDEFGIVKLIDKFSFRNHLCLKFELLDISLYQCIRKNNFKGFSLSFIKKIAKQISKSLKFLHDNDIIHCDLKPENILFKDSKLDDIKLIDLGTSTFSNKRYYNYIQTRFYRAPEIILGLDYSTKIDIWSLGCIMAELFIGRPIFAGENEMEQLQCIMEYLGPPPISQISRSPHKHIHFTSTSSPKIHPNVQNPRHPISSKSLKACLNSSDSNFIDLITKCLTYSPDSRLSINSFQSHPWFSDPSPSHAPNPSSSNLKIFSSFSKLFTK